MKRPSETKSKTGQQGPRGPSSTKLSALRIKKWKRFASFNDFWVIGLGESTPPGTHTKEAAIGWVTYQHRVPHERKVNHDATR
jgi:hypothetical protein